MSVHHSLSLLTAHLLSGSENGYYGHGTGQTSQSHVNKTKSTLENLYVIKKDENYESIKYEPSLTSTHK